MTPVNKPRLPGNYILFGMILIGPLLDAFDLITRTYTPRLLAHVGCGLKPFAMIGSVFMPGRLIAFINSQCVEQPSEPTFSIIFFMAKLAVAELGIIIFWIVICFAPVTFNNVRLIYLARAKAEGGIRVIMQIIAQLALVIALCALGLFYMTSIAPEAYIITLLHKFIEDIVAIWLFVTLTVSSLVVALAIVYIVEQWQGVGWRSR